jgi:hypothetical protein
MKILRFSSAIVPQGIAGFMDRSETALIALEKRTAAAVQVLRAIHAELKRGNDMRDAWASEVYDLLKTAKGEKHSEDTV